MAVVRIEAVRFVDETGGYVERPWRSNSWYVIRDDYPFLDILVVGQDARAKQSDLKIKKLSDTAPEEARWQRWDFEEEIARNRRFGEISLELKVPKNTVLQCYIVPTALLSYRDVVIMIEDIESELGINAAWDVMETRRDRAWSHITTSRGAIAVQELVNNVGDEFIFAQSIRREPFAELEPRSRRNIPLPENAIVSHWAVKRYDMLQRAGDEVSSELEFLRASEKRNNPFKRSQRIKASIANLEALISKIGNQQGMLSRICRDGDLHTTIYLGPIFQRDHRLRRLLRAFTPRISETTSSVESERSSYPPVYLNRLWELWGAVWLAKEFRRQGFTGSCLLNPVNKLRSCSWRFRRSDIIVELDYEANPTLVDYGGVPSIHERGMPVLEWAALHQKIDEERPYLGSETKCSPDYLIRITTSAGRALMVGDACLASPKHHAKSKTVDVEIKPEDAKSHTVEKYRRTIGWVSEVGVIRCHPMGGFVLFPPPPPGYSWEYLENIEGSADCTILAPSPSGEGEAGARLAGLLAVISPDMVT